MTLSVGELVVARLKAYGVDTIFGIPGAHTIELYKHLLDYGVRHISARHEQGAGYMADGFSRVTGKPGVCTIVAGPGLTNAASALGTAFADSSPMLVLSSVNAVPDLDMDRGHLHEVSRQSDICRPLVSQSCTVLDASQAAGHVDQAFFMFGASRPRPFHIALPLDILEAPVENHDKAPAKAYRPQPHPEAVSQAVELINEAKRCLIIAGGGSVDAGSAIRELAERLAAPVVTTIAGKGILPDDHPLNLGSTLQRAPVRMAIRAADAVIAIGTQLSPVDLELWPHSVDQMEQMLKAGEQLLPERLGHRGKLVRIDIDPSTMTRDHLADAALVGDSRLAVEAILVGLPHTKRNGSAEAEAWVAELRASVARSVSHREARHRLVLDVLRDVLPEDGFLAADLCQIGYTANVFFPVHSPRRYFYPAGYGPLGFATPAAIGAQLARPDLRGAVLIGDYGFQFTVQELATAVELGLPLPIIIWNNEGLGEIKDWMRHKNAPPIGVEPRNPDFKMLAGSYGAAYSRPASEAAFRTALKAAHRRLVPTVIEIREDSSWLSR